MGYHPSSHVIHLQFFPLRTMNSLPPSLQVKWRDSEDQSAYESARVNKVFNLDRPQRFPRGIVQATCIEDVVGAVKLATLSDMKIAVRSGGHSTFVWSLQNDSILVDLSGWNDVCVDSSAGVAVVTAGVTGEQLTRCLTQHKMMFPTGHHPGVSMGGFILQGGQGWNCRVCTLSAFLNLLLTGLRTGAGHVNT